MPGCCKVSVQVPLPALRLTTASTSRTPHAVHLTDLVEVPVKIVPLELVSRTVDLSPPVVVILAMRMMMAVIVIVVMTMTMAVIIHMAVSRTTMV